MTVAWITGGGTGIGRALAERLVAEGARVVITGRRAGILETARQQIASKARSGEILAVAGDATDPAHIQGVLSRTLDRWGPMDLLVNNAGANSFHAYAETSVEEYRQALETNCLSAIRCSHAVLPGMLRLGRGAIVNVSSVLGRWASAHSASYSVAKYALAGFTDTLRQAMVGQPVHVLGVYPGFIRTEMTRPFVEKGSLKAHFGKDPDDLARAILKALRKRKSELYYPWYVPWLLWFHRQMPAWADGLAARLRR
jgi:uncharacterized protein